MQEKNIPSQLETETIFKLLLRYSIPAIIGTTAFSLYNIIDRIFIGQGVGALAISGLALTLPLMSLSMALGTLVGVGAASVTSIRLGEKKKHEAFTVLGNAFIFNIITGVLYGAIGLFFLDDILYAFGASKDTLPYAKEFMQIILFGNVVTHVYFGLNNIMRASGHPQKSMMTMLTTVAANLILAPTFIFVFHWGIRGAAIATVLSQIVGLIQVLSHFSKRQSIVHFTKHCFKLNWKIIASIFAIGLSPFLLHVCASMVAMFMNVSLGKYGGDMAIGAYGIINSVVVLFAMIVIGLNQGMQPIVGYNYGARNFKRVITTFKYTVVAATCVTSIGFLLAQFLSRQIALSFTNNVDLVNLAVVGLKVTLMSFPLVGFQIVTSNFFQAIGKPKISIFLSLSRQVVFLIPALFFLPRFYNLTGVWAATPTSDAIASLLTLIVLQVQIRKIGKKFI
jgi:putative MATE family efflux protein